MSKALVERVRLVYEAFERGDWEPLLSSLDPDIEWHGTHDAAPVRGVEGVRESVQGWVDAWDEHRNEPFEFIDAGESVVLGVRVVGATKRGGPEVEQTFFQVFTYSDESASAKLVRWREFTDRGEALALAAASEPGD
jgi:ketosteroid isomerase-like protein